MIKAVIFDVDNTLYDYDTPERAAFGAVTEYAVEELGVTAEDFRSLHRDGMRTLKARPNGLLSIHDRVLRYQKVLEELGLPRSRSLPMAALYWETFLAHIIPFSDAEETILNLRRSGLRVGVGTNMTAEPQFRKLERLGLLDLFDFVVTSQEAGVEKPEPGFFELCVSKAGCRAEECLFVGDDLKRDIFGAKNSGLHAVWIPVNGKASAVDVCQVKQLSDLIPLIQKM